MNKKYLFLPIFLFTISYGLKGWAQEKGINAILQQIEANNKALQADKERISYQKLENKSSNNLADPSVSFAHLWDADDKKHTAGEFVISQSFEFPTLYISRNKLNQSKANALDAEANAYRQQVLLQAQELCLDIIMLHQQQLLLDQRLKNAEELKRSYDKRLETGDANILETNKINLELLNVRTEARLNANALNSKLALLQALNGEQPLVAGRPSPDTQTATPQLLGLTEYPTTPLPVDFRPLCAELLAADASLQALESQKQAAQKAIAVNRQGWIPKFELGYKRSMDNGNAMNGVVVGASLPIFQNRHQVKMGKAQATALDFQKENMKLEASATLWNLYYEAYQLNASISEYKQTLEQQQDLALLKLALDGGEISLIEYFVEVTSVYQSKSNLLQLENQYQKVMAQIYKSKL